MKTSLLVFGLTLTIAYGSSLVNIRLPYVNPAGVTYINGPTPSGLVAGPVPIQYAAQPHLQQLAYATQPALRAAPLQYAQPALRASPITFTQPALRAAPLLQPRVAAVADIPVTQIEAHHGVVQNLVDVAKPAIKTRKFEVRRPAIQKQFYDIEERVIVRPAGSALVELDQPISKNQKGLDIITPLHAVHAAPIVPVSGFVHQPVFVSSTPAPVSPASEGDFSFENQQPSNQDQDQQQPQLPQSDDDSVVIEARSRFQQQPQQPQQINQPLFRGAPQPQQETQAFFPQQSQQQEQQQQQPQERQQQPAGSERQQQSSDLQRQQQIQFQELQQQQQNQLQQLQQRHVEEQQILDHQNENSQSQRGNPQFRSQAPTHSESQPQQQQPQPQSEQRGAPQPQVVARSNGEIPSFRFNQSPQSDSPFVYSRQVTPEESHDNQQRLIQLLTARSSLSEVGNPQSARSSNFNDAGLIRARVLSATPAPYNAAPTDERVNTRRVVLSRPIETIQEVVVQEPVTKFEKVAVNTPTIFKTARLGVQRVHTSLPALPLFQQQHHNFAQTYHGIQK